MNTKDGQLVTKGYLPKSIKKSGSTKWGVAAAIGTIGAMVADSKGKGKLTLALAGAATVAAAVGTIKQRRAEKGLERKKNLAIGRHVYGGRKGSTGF